MEFSVRRSVAWMAVSQAILFLVQFGTTLVVARLLTPYDMGVFAVATAVAGLLSIVRTLGLASYLMRAHVLTEAMLASVFTINALIATLVSVLVACLSTLGGAFLQEAGVQQVLLVLAAIPLINIFELLPATGVERVGNFRAIALVNLARNTVASIVMLGFAFAGYSYMSLAFGQVAGAVIAVVAFNIVGWRHARVRFALQGWREILSYGLQILAISGVNMLSGRLSEILLGRILGLAALGLYSRASGLNNLLSDNIALVVARVVFVDFSEQKRRGLTLRDSYLHIVKMITALLWPAFAGMAVLAGPLVLTLYGEAWTGASLPLSLLAVSAIVLVSITMTWEVFVVCRETARQAKFEFVRAGIGLMMFAAGCFVGLTWAAAARIGEALFSMALYRPHLERMTDTIGGDFVPIYLSSLALTFVAVAPAVVAMTCYGWAPDAPLPVLLGAVAVGVACWGVLLVVMRHPLAMEGRVLINRLLPGQFALKIR